MDPIVLIGFMGSGKTTLGRRLAAALGVDFIDLDERLEAASGCSIRVLVERDGEAAFRVAELDVLRGLVEDRPADCVVATGGGVVESRAGRDLIARLGRVVWLRSDPEACIARLDAARAARPLLDDAHGWRARYAGRAPLYAAAAECVIDTHPDGVEDSLRSLLRWLGRVVPPADPGG